MSQKTDSKLSKLTHYSQLPKPEPLGAPISITQGNGQWQKSYDNLGRLVKQILSTTEMKKGTSSFIFNSNDVDLIGGVYTCTVETAIERKSVKLIYID